MRFRSIATLAGVCTLWLAACGDENGTGVSGTVRVAAGPGALELAQSVAQRFREENPDARVAVARRPALAGPGVFRRTKGGATAAGFRDFLLDDGDQIAADGNLVALPAGARP